MNLSHYSNFKCFKGFLSGFDFCFRGQCESHMADKAEIEGAKKIKNRNIAIVR